jgi:hypothetical protein
VSKPRIVQFQTNTCQLWVREFLEAKGITYEIGPPMRYDQFGSEYTELLLRAPIPHRESTRDRLVVLACTEEQAKTEYQRVLLVYLGNNRHIVWRVEPEINKVELRHRLAPPLFDVYSRLNAYPAKRVVDGC